MAQWIAILVVLVCLSASSFSRSWVGFDDTDDFESWQADPDDDGSNQKSRYHSREDSLESDDDFDDSEYENGEHDKPISSNNGYYKDHGSQGYHGHHQVGHHYDHGYNGNGGYHGHHTQDRSQGQPDQYWGSIGHHSHSTSSHQPAKNWGSLGHHGQTGSTGQPGENGVSHGYQQSQTGSPDHDGQNVGRHEHNTQSANPGQPGNAQGTGSSRGLPQNNMNRPIGARNDADRIVFPDSTNQIPTTRSPSTTRPAITTARTTARTAPQTAQTTPQTTQTTTDRTLLDLVICIRACPATPEYNPVCGTNNVTYNNPGALQCARNCGLDVALARQAPCPQPIPQPPITSRPITNPNDRRTARPLQGTTSLVNPTRFTSINVNFVNRPRTTIPIEILQNVFGNASPTTSIVQMNPNST